MIGPLAKKKQKGPTPSERQNREIHAPPKKARKGWTEKHCSLCKKHGDTHMMHNTKESRCCKSGDTLKKTISNPKSDKPSRDKDGMNFAQIIRAETRKAVRAAFKKSNCSNKRRCHQQDSDSDSDSDY